jgi:hypothetical protein
MWHVCRDSLAAPWTLARQYPFAACVRHREIVPLAVSRHIRVTIALVANDWQPSPVSPGKLVAFHWEQDTCVLEVACHLLTDWSPPSVGVDEKKTVAIHWFPGDTGITRSTK